MPVTSMRAVHPRAEALGWLAFGLLGPVPLALRYAVSTDGATWLLLSKLVLLAGVPIGVLWTLGYGWRDLVPEAIRTPWTPVSCALAFAIASLPNLGHLTGIRGALAEGGSLGVVGLAAIAPLLTAAIPEELLFRGILHTHLERLWGRVAGVVLGAALFALWHVPSRYLFADGAEGTAGDLVSVLQGTALPVFVVGLFFGAAWDRWRNLPALICAHWALDLLPSVSTALGIRY